MTDIAAILASYRSGQIDEAAMVDICREWPEVEDALKATSITDKPRYEAIEAGGCAPPIIVAGAEQNIERKRATFSGPQAEALSHLSDTQIMLLSCEHGFEIDRYSLRLAATADQFCRLGLAELEATDGFVSTYILTDQGRAMGELCKDFFA